METWTDEESSPSDSSVENEATKEKKISMIEIAKYLRRERTERTVDTANRTGTSAGRESNNAYSCQCALDPPMLASVLKGSNAASDNVLLSCPSDNIGVRSMSFEFPDVDALGEFEAFAFAEILQDAIDALEVLKHTVKKDIDANERNQRIMMRKPGSCSVDDECKLIFGRDAGYVPVVKSISEKLYDNRDLVCNVFQKVACELRQRGTYDWLRCEVNTIIDSKEKEKYLEINRKIWLDLIKKLRESQKQIKDEFEKKKSEYTEDFEKLAAEIDTSYCDNRDKLDYIRRWEKSKLEQHNYRLTVHEESVLNEIKELEIERKRDAKVSEELQSYGKSAIYSCENEIASWTERYHEELEKRQQEINQLQESIEALQESLEKIRDLQKERQVVVDEYMEEQKKINDENEYWKTVNEQATIIQSIWRGYMVRHRLGPFDAIFKLAAKRKKKKSKKPKNPKKKKKD
ncbi:dynein regulatory complex protein 9 [Phymastichus coffea]|uniref:dynein regulatory complex protein 9 n=1 Tax=Phymastichus coffea TaxID=108790 RepID=UPI00273CBEA9|nr:dynein regulatory complex protein 9 [Phymastichus coffea]